MHIAEAFPGLFTYSELVHMDIRDRAFWLNRASIVFVRRELLAKEACLLPNTKTDVIQKDMNKLQGELRRLQVGNKQYYRENREKLAKRAR